MEAVDPWEVIRTAFKWVESPQAAPDYEFRGETRRRHDCGDPDCVSGAVYMLLREALASAPSTAPVATATEAKNAVRDAAIAFGEARFREPRDTAAMQAASRDFEKAMSVLAVVGATNPKDAAEVERWIARIKTLEARMDRAAAILRGEMVE